MKPEEIFPSLPAKVRNSLIKEFSEIERNYLERRWSPSELSGGRFCEIVYCIIAGHTSGKYELKKPNNMVDACRKLEQEKSLPRSFQILIPRILPAIYEVRNNRNVGHIGGDVDPSHMDATFVLNSCNWIMAELVRVLHGLSVASAQSLTDNLAENRIPFIWKNENTRRVLIKGLSLKQKTLILLASCQEGAEVQELQRWADYANRPHFKKILRELHSERLIEFDESKKRAEILPPGTEWVRKFIGEHLDAVRSN